MLNFRTDVILQLINNLKIYYISIESPDKKKLHGNKLDERGGQVLSWKGDMTCCGNIFHNNFNGIVKPLRYFLSC